MAGTTTYLGISYPQSTDLVKDGAANMQTIATGFDTAVAIPTFNAQTGATYTFAFTDIGKTVSASNASASVYTVTTQALVAWPTGTTLNLVNLGAGTVSIAGAVGVTVSNTAATLSQYASASIVRTGSDAWSVIPFAGGVSLLTDSAISGTTGSPTTTTYSTYKTYAFTGSGSITTTKAGLIDILLVSGGAGGGGTSGGGSGAGGGGSVATQTLYLTAATNTVTVGAGGAGGTSSGDFSPGKPGVPSSLGVGTNTALAIGLGGGGGGSDNAGTTIGRPGSSGGAPLGTALITGLGFAAGSNANSGTGGGGGAGAVGANGTQNNGGAGGAGATNTFRLGTSVTYGGGGGGWGSSSSGAGGSGGGGTVNVAGTANTGGAGGARIQGTSGVGNAGGSGLIVIRVLA